MLRLFTVVLTALCVITPARSLAGDPAGHRIEVRVDGLAVDAVKLAYHLGSKQYILVEDARVTDERVVFEGVEALESGVYMFVVPPTNEYFEFVVDADQHFSLNTRMGELVPAMVIEGSVENEVFFADLRFLSKMRDKTGPLLAERDGLPEGAPRRQQIDEELAAIDVEVKQARRTLQAEHGGLLYAAMLRAMAEPDVPEGTQQERFEHYRAHFFDGVDFSDARLLRTPIIESKLVQFLDTLTVQTPEEQIAAVDELLELSAAEPEVFKFVAIHLLNRYANSRVMCMDAAYVHVADRVYKAGKATWADPEQTAKIVARAESIRPTMCGSVAPDAALVGRDGEPVSLHAVQADFTVIYVWKPGCGHCKRVAPALKDQLIELESANVALVTVNTSRDDGTPELDGAGLTALPGSIHAHVAGSEFHEQYDVRSVPQILVLDRDKRILGKQLPVEQVANVVRLHRDKGD